MTVIQSLIRDKAEVYVAQYLRDLSSSSDGLEFGNTTSFSNPFEFINNFYSKLLQKPKRFKYFF